MLRPGDELAMATDAETFARGAKPAVLLAIARPTASVVLAIDACEYTWEEVAYFAGWDLKPCPPRTKVQPTLPSAPRKA